MNIIQGNDCYSEKLSISDDASKHIQKLYNEWMNAFNLSLFIMVMHDAGFQDSYVKAHVLKICSLFSCWLD